MHLVHSRHVTFSAPDPALVAAGADDGDSKKKKMSRPFGVALLMAGYDDQQGSQLYFSDPSGTFY
mgnify:CR=1 FL=1